MDDNTYNGWNNYATWRVQLELVDDEVRVMLDNDPEYFKGKNLNDTADEIKEMVESMIADTVDETTAYTLEHVVAGWAQAFTQEVDWLELAKAAHATAKDYVVAA